MAFTTLDVCLEKFKKLSNVWKEAGKKYYKEWRRRIKSAGSNPNTKDLKDKKILQDEGNLKEFANPNSDTVKLYAGRFNNLGIPNTKYKKIFDFYKSVQDNNNNK